LKFEEVDPSGDVVWMNLSTDLSRSNDFKMLISVKEETQACQKRRKKSPF